MNEPCDKRLSETDFIHFCRCPYAYSMYQAGLVPPSEEERDGMGGLPLPDGVPELFEQQGWQLNTARHITPAAALKMAGITPTGADKVARKVPELLGRMGWKVTADESGWQLKGSVVYENTALRIAGRPDGIDRADGALIPIEVITRLPYFGEDEIEYRPPDIDWRRRWGLAFYWLVLAPNRTSYGTPPLGRVVFEIGEVGREKIDFRDVPLADDVVSVRFAVEKARQAKTALFSYSCGKCNVCKARFAHRLQLATEQRSLALVTPISFRQALDLERVGIVTVEDLVSADAPAISRAARVSEKRAEAWKRAASAAVAGSPVALRKPEILPDHANMIALDTEYGEFRTSSWVIGIRVVRRGAGEDHILWAHLDDGGYQALKRTAKLLRENRDLPIVTWNGRADLERIVEAAERWRAVGRKIGVDRDDVTRRHVDMLKVVRGSIALPIPKLRLKEVAQYLGVAVDPVKARLKRAPGILHPHVVGVDAEGFPELTIADGRDAQEAIHLCDQFRIVDTDGLYVMGGDLRRTPPADYLAIERAVEEYLCQDLRLTTEVTKHVVELHRLRWRLPRR